MHTRTWKAAPSQSIRLGLPLYRRQPTSNSPPGSSMTPTRARFLPHVEPVETECGANRGFIDMSALPQRVRAPGACCRRGIALAEVWQSWPCGSMAYKNSKGQRFYLSPAIGDTGMLDRIMMG